jgi:hypothetical protein
MANQGPAHEVLIHDDVPMPSARSTGLVFAAVFAIVAILFRATADVVWVAGTLAVLFLQVSLLRPALLEPLNRAWFRLALALNRIVSPLVMLVLFWTTIVPFGLVMQLFRDPLQARRSAAAATYWIERRPADRRIDMCDQF